MVKNCPPAKGRTLLCMCWKFSGGLGFVLRYGRCPWESLTPCLLYAAAYEGWGRTLHHNPPDWVTLYNNYFLDRGSALVWDQFERGRIEVRVLARLFFTSWFMGEESHLILKVLVHSGRGPVEVEFLKFCGVYFLDKVCLISSNNCFIGNWTLSDNTILISWAEEVAFRKREP